MPQKFSNKEIVSLLKEVLASMEVKNYQFFKIRAYQNAIAVLDNLTTSIYDIWEAGNLDNIPAIGATLSQHLDELFRTGKVKEFEHAKKDLPEGMFGLLSLRGIGAKKAFKLASTFKLTNKETAIEKLKEYAQKGQIKVLPGFGDKSEKDVLSSIEQTRVSKSEKERTLLIKAEEIVYRILKYMKELDCVKEIEAAGSYRRRNATVGDLDIPVASTDPDKTMAHFLKYHEIDEVATKGDKRSTVILKNGMQADLYICDPKAYGAMLQYFTGSKQHNIVLRTYALEKGLSLSEYGIKKKGSDKIIEFSNEEDFYKYLDLQYIPPELRNGTNEVELAIKHKLPSLIELKDIRGDLHMHTNASDGVNTLDEMVDAAVELGYEYIGIADHAPSIQTRGEHIVERIIEKRREDINNLNKNRNEYKVLLGYEINILAEGGLAWPDRFLQKLDFVIAGIHTSFSQDKEHITKRLLSAIENEYVDIIAHPMGRLLNERNACDVNWEKVFDAAAKNKKILEINSYPNRLDLDYDLVRMALDRGVKIMINTDAHETSQLLFMRCGIDVARRAGCEKKDILNTMPYAEFVKHLRLK